MTSMRIEPVNGDERNGDESEERKGQPIETVSDTYEDLIREISKETKILILLFSSPICTPCKKIKRQIESGIGERVIDKGQFFYVNIQENGGVLSILIYKKYPILLSEQSRKENSLQRGQYRQMKWESWNSI